MARRNAIRNEISFGVAVSAILILLGSGCGKDVESGKDQPSAASAEATKASSLEEAASPAASAYAEEIIGWQESRRTRLQAEDGWLSLVGLFWLRPGGNRIGSAPTNEIVLPSRVAPLVGIVHLETGPENTDLRIRFVPENDSGVTIGGKNLAGAVVLQPDSADIPTTLEIGTIRFHAIVRGDRVGIRVKDSEAPSRLEFKGLDYFPVLPAWRIDARFEPYDPPKSIPIANIIGLESEEPSPGAIVFKVRGRTYRLDVLDGGAEEFFVIFSDRTSGRETYGAGRYLYTRKPGADGRMVIDFNKAYNPPCAFTEFATCPLPPRQNRLPFRVEAGEIKYAAAEH